MNLQEFTWSQMKLHEFYEVAQSFIRIPKFTWHQVNLHEATRKCMKLYQVTRINMELHESYVNLHEEAYSNKNLMLLQDL